MKIDMKFIKQEVKNQVVDKLENMCCSEISVRLYDFLQDKKEIICKSVYEVLKNNECVVNTNFCHLNAKDGFTEDLVLDWELIDEYYPYWDKERAKIIQSTILYNYDALWMAAIHKAFPNNTTNTQCGDGEMDLIFD